ncbi:MAG: molecular chaperone TorD family protein [Acidimicrobiales bacterium]|jgi:TorA maturation chaperone TorD
MTEMPTSNGAGNHRGTVAPTPAPEARSGADETGPETIIAAVDLLAHYWSRPLSDEVGTWVEARELEAETDVRISSNLLREAIRVPGLEDVPVLLEEYERLFVGPGQVPCPPYESFWREDVPVDIRRTLMGPCTAELKEIYLELGLQVSSLSGELPDHIAIELEAMAYALSFDETEPMARRLFDKHLAQWLPRLCRAVAHEAEGDFYRDLAVLTLDWIAAIKGYFAVAPAG